MLDHKTKACVPCGLHRPVRNAYFDGRLLDSRAFTAEQDYIRGHRHMHNAMLHGTGTVCGLRLIQHPTPGCRREYLVIEPGLAIDCCGQEIVVHERAAIPVREMIEADPDLAEALDGERHLLVAIRRCDVAAEKMPVILPGCEGDHGSHDVSYIGEGYEFVLLARAEEEVKPVETPFNPRLEWIHTIVLGAQVPVSVHLNEDEKLVQIAAANIAGGSHLYAHRDDNHDLHALLEGPQAISDTQSSRASRLLLAAGQGFDGSVNGVGVWRAAELRENAAPAGIIPIEGEAARVAVSPTSGAVFVLDFLGAGSARLVSYSAESIDAWLESGAGPAELARLDFDHGFGGAGDAPLRGASMMAFSHDGRYLAIAAPEGRAQNRLYLIDVAAFNGGGLTLENARAKGYATPGNERLVALSWVGEDDERLYLLTRRPTEGGRMILTRHVLTGSGNRIEPDGQGVWIAGRPLDLAVAPTERYAYVLLTDAEGVTRLTTVDNELVKARASATPVESELSDDALRIDGAGRALALEKRGGRAYVSAADAAPGEAPERGHVAVIGIREDDCGAFFDAAIDGCPACEDDERHAVILGHLPGYSVADDGDGPSMMDPDEAGPGDVAIDNLTYRRIVPSAASLRKVVECILARGVAEGPPGPRGDPGADGADGEDGEDGADGRSIDTVNVTMTAPGTSPTGETVPNNGALALNLSLPRAADGADGAGIDGATIEYRDIAAPQVQIVTESGQRILDIDLPEPEAGAGLPEVNPIIATSWKHGEPIDMQGMDNFADFLMEVGIAVAFENKVPWPQFTGSREPGPTMLVELQRRADASRGFFHWESLGNLRVHPIEVAQINGTLLERWNMLSGADGTQGFAVTWRRRGNMPIPEFKLGETVRLVFYADFVLDEEGRAVDGSLLGGRLPTGKGAPGDTFRSWFVLGEPG